MRADGSARRFCSTVPLHDRVGLNMFGNTLFHILRHWNIDATKLHVDRCQTEASLPGKIAAGTEKDLLSHNL